MSQKTKTATLFAAAALMACASLTQAHAGAYELRFAEAALSTDSGVERLYGEIVAVAEEYCDDYFRGYRMVRNRANRERCVDDVIVDIVSDIDHPRLYEEHARWTN